MNSIVANLIVPSIEDCLPFYVERLGFTRTVEVPHEDKLGFVILKRGELELMLQSRASVADDIANLGDDPFRAALYIEVDKLAPIREALTDWPRVIPERTTFYGAREIIVRDLGSTNGTLINNRRTATGRLRVGDELLIAGFRYRLKAGGDRNPGKSGKHADAPGVDTSLLRTPDDADGTALS